MMLHHIELYVSNLQRSVEFWTPFMERLGYVVNVWQGGVNYLDPEKSGPYLCLLECPKDHVEAGYHRKRVGLNHLAFRAKSRQHVDSLHDWAKQTGHVLLYDELFPHATAPDYYAMYCEDPDRIKLEVVAPPYSGSEESKP